MQTVATTPPANRRYKTYAQMATPIYLMHRGKTLKAKKALRNQQRRNKSIKDLLTHSMHKNKSNRTKRKTSL